MSVLVHLVEPADWRAALVQGSLRPPSLAEAGFVHLSSPDQVHLPAAALYPGRRDLVLLVVDPSRLTDPVRWEPGRSSDPPGMVFPHLYGPLPVTAVVAAVPYLPGRRLTIPAPDDALGRALAFYASLPVRRALGVGAVPGGVAVLDPDIPYSRDNNRLVLTVAGNAGWPHQAAGLLWPDAGEVAADLAGRGWEAEELLLMARPAGSLPGGGRAEVVDQREVHPLWDRSWREGLAGRGPLPDHVVPSWSAESTSTTGSSPSPTSWCATAGGSSPPASCASTARRPPWNRC